MTAAPQVVAQPWPQLRPVWITGARSGVGAHTLARLVAPEVTAQVRPHGTGLFSDVVVTSPHAGSMALLAAQMQPYHVCGLRPVLVLMRTVPGRMGPHARARLRTLRHLACHTVEVPFIPGWLDMPCPPGDPTRFPGKARTARADILKILAVLGHQAPMPRPQTPWPPSAPLPLAQDTPTAGPPAFTLQ